MLVLVAALVSGAAAGQPSSVEPGAILAWGEEHVLEAEFVNHRTRVDGPRLPPNAALRAAASVFEISIEGEIPEATAALHAAADIWTSYLSSDVPIEVTIVWTTMGDNILGSSSPRLVANFAGAPRRDMFFPTALANALEARNLFPDHSDITINLNAAFEHWYFGIDGDPPEDTFDLVTVVMHEIGHGLGFMGTMRVSGGLGQWGTGDRGFPMIYDMFSETDHLTAPIPLLDTRRLPNPSAALAMALESQEVFLYGPTAVAAQLWSLEIDPKATIVPSGGRPKLYAPDPWVAGSSYSHLTEERDADDNEIFYPPGSLNSLMTPRLGATEVIRTPGPIMCGVLRDVGWPLGSDCLALLPEQLPTAPADEDVPMLIAGPCPHPAVGGRTAVQVHARKVEHITATVYDVLGRRVGRVIEAWLGSASMDVSQPQPRCIPGGPGHVALDLRHLASGMYLLRIRAEHAEQTVRLVVVN